MQQTDITEGEEGNTMNAPYGSTTEVGAVQRIFSPRIVATDFYSPSSPPSIIVLCSAVTPMSAIAAAASINSGVIFPGSTAPATVAAGRTLAFAASVNKAPGNNGLSQPHDGAHANKPPPIQPRRNPFAHFRIIHPLRPGNNSSEELRSF
jgi:hypothetical protein